MNSPPFLANRYYLTAQLFCTLLLVSAGWSQATEPVAAEQKNVPEPAPTSPVVAPEVVKAPVADDIVELSPFQVEGSSRGYQAVNTMSGTRLNAKLEDLAASISVVTKQQLEDTAAIDINDIFQYESNTEGMGQFTQFVNDRDFYREETIQNPQSANRIRGLGSANISVNNFSTSGIVPIDTYIVDSVEISRGPNSNIFGLGNASGTVNLVTGDARLDRDLSQVSARADSYGGWRASANFNRVLAKQRLAIRVAMLRDEKGFVRDPSYEDVNRVFASVTVRPFRNTTIRAAYESYRNRFSRANTTLPRDSITQWLASDRPVWNPTYTAGGATGAWRALNSSSYFPVTTGNENTQLPTSLLAGSGGFWNSPTVHIEPDGSVSFYGMNAVGTANPAPPSTPIFRYVETGSIYRRASTTGTPLILYKAPSITDKSLYDWTEMNILSPNYGRDKGDVYRVELNQGFFSSALHRLDAQVGQYREVIDRYDHSVFSKSDSAVPYIVVDVNETLLDGTPNPNFLRPYMGGSQPTLGYRDERQTHTRGALAYQIDFATQTNWQRWLGRHTLNGYVERRDILNTNMSARDINTANVTGISANDRISYPLRGNTYRIYPRYYLGDALTAGGPVIDNAPATSFHLGSTPFTWYTTTRARNQEVASIQEVIQSGSSRDREVRSKGLIWMGGFWRSADDRIGDRIIPTLGWRKDRNRERSSRNLNSNPTQANTTIDPATFQHDLTWTQVFPTPWEEKRGSSRQQGVVFKATSWLNLNYNQSDSFKPETLAYNIRGELLQNPSGKTKDYGVTLKLLDNKVVARVTRYETQEKNSRNGSIDSAAVTRTLRLFFDPSSSNRIQGGLPPNPTAGIGAGDQFDLEEAATEWVLWGNPGWTIDQARQAAADTYLKPLGLTDEYIEKVRLLGASAYTDVNTVTSKGTEIELTVNPTRNWTIKVAGAQQKAVDTELANTLTDFVDARLDAIRAVRIPTNPVTTGLEIAGDPWWTTGQTSTSTNTAANFYIQNVKSVIGLATANAGKPRTQTREYSANLTSNYSFAGHSDSWIKNAGVGGSLRWASKASLGYYGSASSDPEYRGAIVEYDSNRPIYDDPRTAIDLWASYTFRLHAGKVRCKLQLNVKNVTESGRLQPIAYNPDGMAWNYRIIDPRQFLLTASFDL